MVSKRWQRTQTVIAHIGLALGAAMPLYLFELQYENWIKVVGMLLGYLILIPLFRWLHRKYAKTFVKVFRCDYEAAARVVQRALNADRLPFTKRSGDEQIVFQIRPGKMKLVIDAFTLNMPLDSHLIPEVAAKLTLEPETADNAEQMAALRLLLDKAFAVQGW
ncbi:MAG: hypothetical protein ACPG8W_19345 [Candidatus Promineifilaceae bacterium]